MGTKLQKTVDYNTYQVITDYRDGYQYETKPVAQGGRGYAELLFFPTAEGYVKALYKDAPSDHAPAAYQYVYIYKDHLGNNRLSYTLDPKTNQIKILEENHYYPFGLKHGNYNAIRKDVKYQELAASKKEVKQVVPEAVKFKYLYNGKELQDELGLNWDSFKYRNYDYAIGRFMSVDPLAEDRNWVSPYNFVQNNPLTRIDLDGALDNPVFGSDGTYRGNTKEGYTGQPIIYDGPDNFETMEANQLINFGGNYWQTDIALTPNATAKIYNHILDNVNFSIDSFYDVVESKTYPNVSGTFKLSLLDKKTIQIYDSKTANMTTTYDFENPDYIKIQANIQLGYKPTVENIRATAIIHEFYVHGKLKLGDYNASHRIAYLATMYSNFWEGTTNDYKKYVGVLYNQYYKVEKNFFGADTVIINHTRK